MASTQAPLNYFTRALSQVPVDVLQRLLAGVPLADHRAAASVCKSFRDVIRGPRFLALRRRYGFAEYGLVVVGGSSSAPWPLEVRMASERRFMAQRERRWFMTPTPNRGLKRQRRPIVIFMRIHASTMVDLSTYRGRK